MNAVGMQPCEADAAQARLALELMHEARKLLFQTLHEGGQVNRELADGVEKLGLAFEFAENPNERICMCPACECHFYERVEGFGNRCLSCDEEWQPEEE